MDANGSDQENLTQTPYAVEFFSAWSPTGTHITFDSDRKDPFSGDEDVYIMDEEGSGETKISGILGADDYGPSW
jgi:Tol biopolymer transport system component